MAHVGLSINDSIPLVSPSYHPNFSEIFHEINHPAAALGDPPWPWKPCWSPAAARSTEGNSKMEMLWLMAWRPLIPWVQWLSKTPPNISCCKEVWSIYISISECASLAISLLWNIFPLYPLIVRLLISIYINLYPHVQTSEILTMSIWGGSFFMGGTPSHHLLSWDFPWKWTKLSFWGTPWPWKPPFYDPLQPSQEIGRALASPCIFSVTRVTTSCTKRW